MKEGNSLTVLNDNISTPVKFQKGFHQEDLISGLFVYLAIEILRFYQTGIHSGLIQQIIE